VLLKLRSVLVSLSKVGEIVRTWLGSIESRWASTTWYWYHSTGFRRMIPLKYKAMRCSGYDIGISLNESLEVLAANSQARKKHARQSPRTEIPLRLNKALSTFSFEHMNTCAFDIVLTTLLAFSSAIIVINPLNGCSSLHC
jgi:hypothetical protein